MFIIDRKREKVWALSLYVSKRNNDMIGVTCKSLYDTQRSVCRLSALLFFHLKRRQPYDCRRFTVILYSSFLRFKIT